MKRTKSKSVLLVVAMVFLLSGCFVYSFYPLYTDDDLFVNDLLIGEWMDQDSTLWKFEHEVVSRGFLGSSTKYDSTAYDVKIKAEDDTTYSEESLVARIIKLEENYFIDFCKENHLDEGSDSYFDMYLFPVHVFAKLELDGDKATIKYFNPEWLGRLIRENKIRIHHEKTDDRVLLTAKPKELQKFVLKYVNSEEAFEEDFTVNLIKQ